MDLFIKILSTVIAGLLMLWLALLIVRYLLVPLTLFIRQRFIHTDTTDREPRK
jgi:hypothetical protein